VGTNPAPECHGSTAALGGGDDSARLAGAPAEARDEIEPDPALSLPAEPCQQGFLARNRPRGPYE
jgi:hypothetical protein